MGFSKFGLSDHVMKGVVAAGYTVPTPIQSLAIQPVLEGKDIIGCAQTGTGKTAAFVLPLLHRLAASEALHGRARHPRALVLTPTRELAQQVQKAVDTYGRFLSLRAVAIYGGAGLDAQVKALRRGAEIIVATPGRLLDHMQRKTIDISKIQILVLDEADRMLDMGFIHDVRRIVAATPAERQTLLFSATLSLEISALANTVQRNPHMVEVGEQRNPADTVEQHFYAVPKQGKIGCLLYALEAEQMKSVLIFSRTKHGADKINRRLETQGVLTAAIHSNRSQSQRDRALEGFKRGKVRVLVATDIASRGIDVTGISHVINFDVPQTPEDYIHRVGRTGRAGAGGEAITFITPDDRDALRQIEKHVGKKILVKQYPGFTAPAGVMSEPVHHVAHHVARAKHAESHTKVRTGHEGAEHARQRKGLLRGRKRAVRRQSSESWSNH